MELARAYPVFICRAQDIGYAPALFCGYQFLVDQGWDYVIQLDADGQHDVCYAKALKQELVGVDWVIGSRHRTGSAISPSKQIASLLGRYLLGEPGLFDVSSGYWALNRRAIHYFFHVFPVSYTEAPLRMRAIADGIKIKELCVAVDSRHSGVSMHAGVKGMVHGLKMLKRTCGDKKNIIFYKRIRNNAIN